MCGNGIRVFALHLADEGLVDADHPIPIGTRGGLKTVTILDAEISVDMGVPDVFARSKVAVGDRVWEARHISTGNPHAVVLVDSLADAGTLLDEPEYDQDTYPDGVNIEFVERQGANHVAMRVHERGSGETRSCGTGACAVGIATALADQADRPVTYQVDVPGGTVHVTWTEDNRMILAGPAVIVARGEMEWIV
jgi:diaminopimelate epimerase